MRPGLTQARTKQAKCSVEPLTLAIIKDRMSRGQPASRVERKWLVERLEDALLGESSYGDIENCWAESDADCERDAWNG